MFAAADYDRRIQLGPIDVWINDAMVTVFSSGVADHAGGIPPGDRRDLSRQWCTARWRRCGTRVRSTAERSSRSVLRLPIAAFPLQSAYCGAKHAIRGFTNSLRTELIYYGSRIWPYHNGTAGGQYAAVRYWARTHMARQPRPVAPVMQPEVIARARCSRRSDHPRREVWIGLSTLKVILGNMVLPEFLDHYLAKVAFQGQETSQPVSSDRKDNLMLPVHSLHRTRGPLRIPKQRAKRS